jgi:hypothetical protein
LLHLFAERRFLRPSLFTLRHHCSDGIPQLSLFAGVEPFQEFTLLKRCRFSPEFQKGGPNPVTGYLLQQIQLIASLLTSKLR